VLTLLILAILGDFSQRGSDGDLHHVCYFRRKLNGPELLYPAREQDSLAIVSSLRHWQDLVEVVPVHIESDHQSLASFMKPGTQLVNKQHRRGLDEFGHQDLPSYIKGKDNVGPDALSRRPDLMAAALYMVNTYMIGRVRTVGAQDFEYVDLS
jgi:hypothetical protein